MKSWFNRSRVTRNTRNKVSLSASLVQQLEGRRLLAGVTFSSTATTLTVNGTTENDEIEVYIESGEFVIQDAGDTISTGVMSAGITSGLLTSPGITGR